MITPRRTSLLRASDLATFQRAICDLVTAAADPWSARRTVVLVPTVAAAAVLRRTLETSLMSHPSRVPTLVMPCVLTRDGWYREMHRQMGDLPSLLRPLEREARMLLAARAACDVSPPPFKLRAGLAPVIVGFYDQLKRHRRSVDVFERVLSEDLDGSVDLDRGARRLLQQTKFLVETFRRYEEQLEREGALDEHGLRARVLGHEVASPVERVIVAMSDHVNDAAGLWPADFDLLTRVSGLQFIDVVATDRTLDAGFYERITELLPGIEEERVGSTTASRTVVAAPPGGEARHYVWRDREEELLAVVRRLRRSTVARRTAVVYQRPLPYLYLARQVFDKAGVTCLSHEAFPLATEPYVAAVDLVCRFVLAHYDRSSTVALLRSPHFEFSVTDGALSRAAVEELDKTLAKERFGGGRDRLGHLASMLAGNLASDDRARSGAAVAARVAVDLAEELAPLECSASVATHLDTLAGFLRRHGNERSSVSVVASREDEARDEVTQLMAALARAHGGLNDEPQSFAESVAMLKRTIEGRTFGTASADGSGVQLVDTRAAAYGVFDDLFLLGLVEGEWPGHAERNVFYPSSLLIPLGWPRERETLKAARAAFADLLDLPGNRVVVSTIALENDSVVTPSVLLEEIGDSGLPIEEDEVDESVCVTLDDALALGRVEPADIEPSVSAWVERRAHSLSRADTAGSGSSGSIGPRAPDAYAVSGLELYLDCPFKYLARRVLRLDEEPIDEPFLTSRGLGQVLHAVFEAFFREWKDPAGRRAITPDTLDLAIARFRALAETVLAPLPPSDRAVIRSWLLGSAAASGLAERLFVLEISRPAEVQERLTELRVDGEVLLSRVPEPRVVRLRGVVDRVDLFSDGTFRVVDYKTTRAPDKARSLQLPLYAQCLEATLDVGGRKWRAAEASYAVFGDASVEVAMRGDPLEAERRRGEQRAAEVVDGIERGEFPVRPFDVHRCSFCAYPTVCRKDYVGDE